MRYIAATILIAFLGALFIGLLPMGHRTHHVADATPCPVAFVLHAIGGGEEGDMASLHFSVVHSLLSGPVSSLFAMFILFLFVGISFAYILEAVNRCRSGYRPLRSQQVFFNTSSAKRRSWLALFELSPSIV